jgi:predicted RNA-binding Zn ribbon-like protein
MPAHRYTPDEAALTRVLTFAQADLSTWRDGDWLNAADDMLRSRLARPRTTDLVRLRKDLKLAHRAVREVLEALGRMRDAVDAGQPPKPLPVPFHGLMRLSWPADGRGPFVREPELREVGGNIKSRLIELLTRVDAERLRRCQECGRWFVALRVPQDYDTPLCGNRRRVRLYLQRQRKGERLPRTGRRRARPRPGTEVAPERIDLMTALHTSLRERGTRRGAPQPTRS